MKNEKYNYLTIQDVIDLREHNRKPVMKSFEFRPNVTIKKKTKQWYMLYLVLFIFVMSVKAYSGEYLTWKLPDNADGTKLYYTDLDTTQSALKVLKDRVTKVKIQDLGLIPGNNYKFAATAYNDAGESSAATLDYEAKAFDPGVDVPLKGATINIPNAIITITIEAK